VTVSCTAKAQHSSIPAKSTSSDIVIPVLVNVKQLAIGEELVAYTGNAKQVKDKAKATGSAGAQQAKKRKKEQ